MNIKELRTQLQQDIANGKVDKAFKDLDGHYGPRSFLVNEYPQRFSAANSRFTLYARCKEMLDFLEAFRV